MWEHGQGKKLEESAELKILKYLARYGPSHMYPFHEGKPSKYKAARSTVYRAKKSLLEHGFIELKKVESHAGKDRKIYRLTRAGVLQVLLFGDSWKDIDQIAHTQADRFLIFRKWRFFIENGVKDRIVRRLRMAIKPPLLEEGLKIKQQLEQLLEIMRARNKLAEIDKKDEESFRQVEAACMRESNISVCKRWKNGATVRILCTRA